MLLLLLKVPLEKTRLVQRLYYGVLVELVTTPPSQGGGYGFDPRTPYSHSFSKNLVFKNCDVLDVTLKKAVETDFANLAGESMTKRATS